MTRRSYIRYIAVAAALFIAGLALGAGKGSDDTSLANSASKIFLTVGLVALLFTGALEVVGRVRARRAASAG